MSIMITTTSTTIITTATTTHTTRIPIRQMSIAIGTEAYLEDQALVEWTCPVDDAMQEELDAFAASGQGREEG